jgi:hypothetical protein
MKTKVLLYLSLVMAMLLGCSLFNNLVPSPSHDERNSNNPTQEITSEAQDVSTDGWLLPDPLVGLGALESYHQQLTVSFYGTRNGANYEWTNTYQRDVWGNGTAAFMVATTNEMELESDERLAGNVDQAYYSRSGAGEPCQVHWSDTAQESDLSFEPAGFLPLIEQATEAGMEVVNEIPTRHYVFSAGESDARVAGDLWLAESGGYIVRYSLIRSGGESVFGEGLAGEKRFDYQLSQVNARSEILYPEGCAPVLVDFPVMEGARDLQRLPELVDYTVSAEAAAISGFYQDELVEQGWAFVKAMDNDPQNVLLVFTNKEQNQSASILLSAGDSGVWVSAIVKPWESTPLGMPFP